MPTIEIHGFSRTIPVEIQKATELERRIWKALEEFPRRDNTLVARGCEHVTDAKGRTMFLRIWMKADEEPYLNDLLACLQHLNLRLQFVQLATQLAPDDDSQVALPLEPFPPGAMASS